MELEINKLYNSNFDILIDLGKLLYHRADQNGGLNKEEVHTLLNIFNESSIEKLYDIGYNACYHDMEQ